VVARGVCGKLGLRELGVGLGCGGATGCRGCVVCLGRWGCSRGGRASLHYRGSGIRWDQRGQGIHDEGQGLAPPIALALAAVVAASSRPDGAAARALHSANPA
jgi:hypothetical protein